MKRKKRLTENTNNVGFYHLRYGKEIKWRFFLYLLLAVFFSFLISLTVSEQIIYFLTKPLKEAYKLQNSSDPHFIFTELTEAFFTRITCSIFLTFYSFLFFFCYQFWLYLKPGLFEFEKKKICIWIFWSFLMLFCSNIFLFFFILPSACKFFISMESAADSFISASSLDTYKEFKHSFEQSFVAQPTKSIGNLQNEYVWLQEDARKSIIESMNSGLDIRLEAKIYPYLLFIIKTIFW